MYGRTDGGRIISPPSWGLKREKNLYGSKYQAPVFNLLSFEIRILFFPQRLPFRIYSTLTRHGVDYKSMITITSTITSNFLKAISITIIQS